MRLAGRTTFLIGSSLLSICLRKFGPKIPCQSDVFSSHPNLERPVPLLLSESRVIYLMIQEGRRSVSRICTSKPRERE